jgi:hypothetical protein
VTDAVLSAPDRQESLSRAYVEAVAAGAGYTTSRPSINRDSVDLTIEARGNMRPKLDIQLKATINLPYEDDGFRFPLLVKNYNDLREPTQTPRILVVLEMPRNPSDWIEVTAEELMLRRAAYWVSLRNAPERENRTSVTITLPRSNRFDIDGLRALMEQSRRGKIG